jgi:hypothetical protein
MYILSVMLSSSGSFKQLHLEKVFQQEYVYGCDILERQESP